MRISPAVGAIDPAMHLIKVDFPAPFGPTMQCTSPAAHVEVDPAEGADPGIGLDEAADLEDGRGGHHATISGRSVRWAMRSPISTFSSVPPHTGSSCSTESTPSNPPWYRASTSRDQSTWPRPGTR